MTRADTIPRFTQEAAWLLGSYRRMDALDVPAFQDPMAAASLGPKKHVRHTQAHPLPTHLPRELAQALGQPVLTRLALFVRYLATPLRYEPDNAYHLHRAVPSARCLYPIALYLHLDGMAYRILPDHMALEPVGPVDGGDGLIALGQVWAIGDKYGGFSPFPVTLEAGMLRAQATHLAQALDLGSGQAMERGLGVAYRDHRLDLPLFAVSLTIGAIELPPAQPVTVAENQPRKDLEARHPALTDLVSLFDASGPPVEVMASEKTDLAKGEDLLTLMRRRNSGNDRVGMAPARPENTTCHPDTFLQDMRHFARHRGLQGAEAELTSALIWLTPDENAGLWIGAGERLTNAPNRPALIAMLRNALPAPGFRYNLAAHTAILTLWADPEKLTEQHGLAALRRAHLAAGALALDASLAAARHHHFARPVRMLKEHAFEAVLPLSGMLIFQVLIGMNRASNVTMEVL